MKTIITLLMTSIFALTLADSVRAQSAPAIEWQKCLGGSYGGEDGYSIIQTYDGGFVVAGSTQSNDGDVSGFHGGQSDMWVVKLSSSGSILWQKCLGGSYLHDQAYSIIQTTDSGFVVAGYTDSGDGDVSGNHSLYASSDAWIVKLSSTGIIQWQKCLGGTAGEFAYSIIQTSDSGFAVAGFTASNDGDVSGNHGNNDAWVIKMSSSGGIQWQKCLGGTRDDYATSIIQTSDSGFAVAGYTNSIDGDVSGNHGNNDAWFIKMSSSGGIQWQKCLGGTRDDYATSIIQTSDSGFALAGYTYSNDGDVIGNHGKKDAWVIKLSSFGGIQWQKCIGGTGEDYATSIIQTSEGGFAVVGSTNSNDGDGDVKGGKHGVFTGRQGDYPVFDEWVVKLSSSGLIQWQKCLGGTGGEFANSIIQTSEGGFAVAGFTNSNDGDVSGNHGHNDLWVVKLFGAANLVISDAPETSAILHRIYPNPVTLKTTIDYILPMDEYVSSSLYNALGEKVLIVEDGMQTSGSHSGVLDVSSLTNGVYYYCIRAGSVVESRKIIVVSK